VRVGAFHILACSSYSEFELSKPFENLEDENAKAAIAFVGEVPAHNNGYA